MTLPDNKDNLKKEYYSWLNRNQPKNYQSIISSAIDAFYRIDETGIVTEGDFSALKAGFNLPPSLSMAEYYCQLAVIYKSVENLILTFSQHALVSIRFNILLFCFEKEPQEMVDVLLQQGLNDRSKLVREKAIDIICRLNKTYLKTHLSQRLKIEKNTDIQQLLKTSYGLMDKGYVLDPHRDNYLVIQLANGGQTGLDIANIDLNDAMDLERLEKKVDGISRS